MTEQPETAGLLDTLIEKVRRTAVREVVTSVEGVDPRPVAYFGCDLVQGDVTQLIDRSFLAPSNAALLAGHYRFVDAGDEPIQACFESFLRLVASLDAPDAEDEG